MAVGQTLPVENMQDNTLNVVKLVAKQLLPDSVQFRGIQVGGATPDEAHKRADSIYTALKVVPTSQPSLRSMDRMVRSSGSLHECMSIRLRWTKTPRVISMTC
jgi:hypothetical protein